MPHDPLQVAAGIRRLLKQHEGQEHITFGRKLLMQLVELIEQQAQDLKESEAQMSIVATIINDLEGQLTTAQGVALDATDAQAIVTAAAAQTPPLTVPPAIVALAGTASTASTGSTTGTTAATPAQ